MNKTLCIVIPSLKAGGSERVAVSLLNFAVDKGYKVHVILMSDQAIFYKLDPRVKVHIPDISSGNRFVYYFRVILFVRHSIKRIAPDAVFALGYKIIPALAMQGIKCRLVGSHRTSPHRKWKPLQGKSLAKILFGLVYPLADSLMKKRFNGMIMQSSEALKLKEKEYSKKCRFKVIPNFVRPVRNYDVPKKRRIICVGRLSEEKGQRFLLIAFSEADLPNWELFIVGDGPMRQELKDLTEKLGIADKTIFTGFRSDVDKLMQESEIFVLPSLIEGFPNALQEAMANGLACISFDCKTGPSELIQDGVNGFLVPPKDAHLMSERIKELCNNKFLRVQFSQKSLKVIEEYSIEKVGQQYLDFILNP